MTSALTEREEQWADLEKFAAEAQAGRGRVALASGPVASGKTALLHVFGEHATQSGFIALRSTCAAAERSLPFGMVRQLFGAGDFPAVDLPAVDLDADDAARALTVYSLCQSLLELARDNPVLIGIDDVQHADQPSLDWLLSFIRRAGSAKVLVVLTETATSRPAHSPLHTELLRHPHCRRIQLAPLSESSVTTLFGGAASAYEISGGNPLLVRALLEDKAGGSQIVPGSNFRQALLSCLHRCEPNVLRVARALAVLGEVTVGDLIESDSEAVTSAIDVMNAAGLLDDEGGFRHPAARSAVLDDMSSPDRRALCLRAAGLLHGKGAPAADIAPFLVDADDTANAWTGAVLAEAAEHALRGERIDEAVRYLELAGRAAVDDDDRAAIVAKLARVEWRVKPSAAVRHFPVLTKAMAAGHLGDRDATALVRQLLWHGRVVDAVSVLDEVRSDQEPQLSTVADRRATELWLACTHPPLARRGAMPLESVKHEVGLGNPTAGPWFKSTAALVNVLSYGSQEQAVTDAEHVLQAARPSDSMSWGPESAMQALLVLVYADRLDLARSWSELLLEQARTAVSKALFTSVRAEVALRQGDLAAAFEDARTAVTLLPPTSWGVAAGFPLGCAITAATRMGRLDDAVAWLEQPIPDTMLQTRHGLHYLHARGEYYLATNRDYAALADFLSCGELMASWGMDMPGLVPWRTSAAEAWLRRGENRAEVRRLINEQLAKVGPDGSRTRGVALRLLAATSQVHSRPQLLAEAVAILEGCGDRFELARALADLSRAYRAVSQHRRASPMARRAWQTADACGAAALCAELLPLCTNIDVVEQRHSSDRLASLTEGERRVAAFAAAGYTNREIAEKLFITTSTIEQHLTRVYRKLNVKYRKDLPAELHTYRAATA
jgi:DNA-binding CsgD family transcriptional regulator